jgi:hypothetical protein
MQCGVVENFDLFRQILNVPQLFSVLITTRYFINWVAASYVVVLQYCKQNNYAHYSTAQVYQGDL